jgi:hypothetical protein
MLNLDLDNRTFFHLAMTPGTWTYAFNVNLEIRQQLILNICMVMSNRKHDLQCSI